jgi:hypothetical protein
MVGQRNKSDCCIAALANAAGVPYAAVKRAFGVLERGGMTYGQLCWILGQFGEWKEVRPRRRPTVAEWLRRHRTGRHVLVLGSGLLGEAFHCVACVDGEVTGKYAEGWPVTNYFTLTACNRGPELPTK